jgi:hypothetical protein
LGESSAVFFASGDDWASKVTEKDGKLFVIGARIFKANTPMKHDLIYTPEELSGAVEGPIPFDLDHNYLVIGEDDKLLKAYMDKENEFLLGDLQFSSPTLQKLVKTGALNGVSVVTQWEGIKKEGDKKFTVGTKIPAISLTEIPYCGDGGTVEGCGITHNLLSGNPEKFSVSGESYSIESCRHSGCTKCSSSGQGSSNAGGDSLSEEDKEKISELTKEVERLKGEQGDKVDLSSQEVQEHTKKEVEKAIGAISLHEKLSEYMEKTKDSDEGKDENLEKFIKEVRDEAVDEYKKGVEEAEVKEKRDELLEEHKDNEHTKTILENLHTKEALQAFVDAADAGEHSLNTRGKTKAAELAATKKAFDEALGKKSAEEA